MTERALLKEEAHKKKAETKLQVDHRLALEAETLALINERNHHLRNIQKANPQARGHRLMWLREPVLRKYAEKILKLPGQDHESLKLRQVELLAARSQALTGGCSYPRYSFVQAGTTQPGCYPDPAACLPLSANTNIRCQVTISGIPLEYAFSRLVSEPYLAVVPPDWSCDYMSIYMGKEQPGKNPFSNPLSAFVQSSAPQWLTLPTVNEGGTAKLFFDIPVKDFDALTEKNNTFAPAVGECFKLAIVWDYMQPNEGNQYVPYIITERVVFGCTNCFIRIDPAECYTSVLTYANPKGNDAFDFDYSTEPGYQNVVELPMYLRDPTMQNEQKVYTRSDGSLVKLFERKEEVYELETELMPYVWHKALDVALSHDQIFISNANVASFDPINTATQFVKKENYEIEYMKAPLSSLGKGHCKLSNADPIHLINNNCA